MGASDLRMGSGDDSSEEDSASEEDNGPKSPCHEALNFISSLPENSNVAIVGSRGYGNLGSVKDFVGGLPDGTTIVSGGARGVDSAAEAAANANGLPTKIYQANWSKYGRSAGMRRNADIINGADAVVAFHDGQSPGTQNSIDRARAQGKPVFIIPPEGC